MPKINKTKPTDFKCPKCGGKCVYEIKTDLFVCARPIVNATGEFGVSCGKFYSNGVKWR